MSNLYYNLREDKGFSGLLKSLFTRQNSIYNLSDANNPREYLQIIEVAKQEVESAEKLFNSASDPDLVEYAIYQHYAAKLKLSYLIKKAKEQKIKAVELTSL